MNALAERLEALSKEEGCALIGFADVSGVPEEVRPALPRAVVFAIALDAEIVNGIRQGPTQAYFDLYNTVNARLDAIGQRLCKEITGVGFQAEFRPSSITDPKTFDRERLSVGFSHKMAATRAGLGWIGKCALLVTPEYGSAVRFATLLTNAELPVGVPIRESRCGDCHKCVRACPGEAPSGTNWNDAMHREDFFDAFACLKSILGRAADLGTVCGMCIPVCPWTERYLHAELNAG